MQAVHDETVKYSCSLCVYMSFSRHCVKVHIRRHHKKTGARLLIIGCIHCEAESVHTECLRNKDMPGEEEFTCEKCNYICSNKRQLRMHTEAVHDGLQRFSCSACSYKSYM